MRTTRPGPGRPAFPATGTAAALVLEARRAEEPTRVLTGAFPALRDLATRYRRSSRTSSPAVRASVLRLPAAAPSPSEAR
ncbi:hypothetical protein [Amycolatopsis sp. WQ 127309]|uniref:hypothetical protein n=1 Tax=Amycolatopsis sp. WQ 127309 TaxID=2932773 RepID=UPI001FF577B0|nr:hypothetical protein [Amycolatopsis sp. WQ 127309]UOZ07142.1 hypothetical protein MUY22_02255 [Amycolatopsis sp. WQ 127309]